MRMSGKEIKSRFASGFCLVETMTTAVVLVVAVLGISGYRYYAAMDCRKAETDATAGRIAALLSESWQGMEGTLSYDPTTHGSSYLTVSSSAGPAKPADFTWLTSFKAVSNDYEYYVTLSYKNISPGLRALNVLVAWSQSKHAAGSPAETNRTFSMTKYTAY